MVVFCISLSFEFQIGLVTADGSVDCTESPNDQENTVHYLVFSEVVAALQILDMDGTLVLKMFTSYELTTISLLYFVVYVFDDVHVFKPASSKEGNSEVYLICTGYKRNQENTQYVMAMANRMKNTDIPMFDLDMIPKDFIKEVYNYAEIFMTFQSAAIQSNIYHFHQRHMCNHDLRYEMISEYCRVCNIRPIPERMKILYKPCPTIDEVNVLTTHSRLLGIEHECRSAVSNFTFHFVVFLFDQM